MFKKYLGSGMSARLLLVLVAAGLAAAPVAQAQRYRLGNFDARASPVSRGVTRAPTSLQLDAVELLRQQMPDLAVSFDERTGVTSRLSNRVGYLSGPESGAPLSLAIEYISARTELLGLTSVDLKRLEVRTVHLNEATGSLHVYLRQTAYDLPLYNGQLQIHINRDGRILSVNNAFLRDLTASVNAIQPSLTALEAVQRAAEEIGISVDYGAVSTARLMLLAIQRGEARLVWNLQLETPDRAHYFDFNVDALTGDVWTRFDWVAEGRPRRRVVDRASGAVAVSNPQAALTGSQLTVYPLPVESPHHTSPSPPADARVVEIAPADPVASSLGWHDTGGTSFTIMRGNNVHAYDDIDDNDLPPAVEPDCGVDLHCDFPIDLAAEPATYVSAAVANLFYWNNIIHDVQYQYGFDEAGGNFQVNNFANGGLGNDDVRAEAQDGGGNCNANFLTLPDGSRPRMQMFTCNDTIPARDGDLDNGVIVHEYAHGISNRTVGGPGNVSCLNNTQQMGEGWSDLLALMYTGEVGDAGADGRSIGTWLFGQSVNGPGIRPALYSTDFGVNNFTYSDIGTQVIPHGVGFVWATAAWEAYWELVNVHGFDPDLYNATGGSGNQRMMLYVQEGMANTACSPTFLDARDGIIQAAIDNHAGEDVCRLWTAFARRGLGTSATTVGPNSLSATDAFDTPIACFLTSTGVVSLEPDPLFCGVSLDLQVADLDLQGTGNLSVGLTATLDSETILLTETSLGSGVFEASVATLEAAAVPGNNQLEVSDGSILTVTYNDADDGSGNPAVVTASVTANCADNLGFELGGFFSWVPQDLSTPLFPLQVAGPGVTPGFGFFVNTPTEGSFSAVHGFDGNGPGTIQLAINLSLPSAAESISFDYRAAWDLVTFGALLDRTFSVDIEPPGGGTALQSDVILVATAGTIILDTGALLGSVDVATFAGQDIRLSFEWDVPEDFAGPAFFQLDAISIEETPLDSDGDGIFDLNDNCIDEPNADQCDSNLDGLGNLCDPDTTNDGAVGVPDFNDLRSTFGQVCPTPWGPCADADFTCDGVVGVPDFNVLRDFFGGPPGLSGLACAGTVPCPASACPHDVCVEGGPLHPACGSCAADVCAADPDCCISGWDATCVEQAASICGLCDGLLYASVPKSRTLLIVDPDTGQASVVGVINTAGNVTEIEWSPDGQTLYGTTGGGASALLTIDPDTAVVLSSIQHTFGAINGLAFDQSGNLLGTFVAGPENPSSLVTIDVATGVATTIGATGFSTIGGLAFSPDFGTLYGITSGDGTGTGNAILLSIDPATGAASQLAVADVTVEFSSLETTGTGRLLAGANDGSLYELDPATGVATLIGATGHAKLSGLSIRP